MLLVNRLHQEHISPRKAGLMRYTLRGLYTPGYTYVAKYVHVYLPIQYRKFITRQPIREWVTCWSVNNIHVCPTTVILPGPVYKPGMCFVFCTLTILVVEFILIKVVIKLLHWWPRPDRNGTTLTVTQETGAQFPTMNNRFWTCFPNTKSLTSTWTAHSELGCYTANLDPKTRFLFRTPNH